jgi:diguanylate cyclase (GGDEF)-like protein
MRSPRDTISLSSLRTAALAGERRTIGRLAGIVVFVAGLSALATLQLLSGQRVGVSVDLVIAATMCSGVVYILVPWDRISALWLHVIPVLAVIELALGIRLANLYGDVAADYYVLVAVFAAYAFSSRQAVAFHVVLAAIASALPLVYANPTANHALGRTVVEAFLLVVIATIITLLREGLQKRQRELEELAVHDPLTGVGNYRLLSDRLDFEIARQRRSGRALTVMLLDLDGFKEINDTFGHLVGDRVLVEVARALSSSVRAQDTLARQGGDEFSILAPETDDADARRLATRARQAVNAVTGGSLTTSVGWVTYPTDTEDTGALLALADADLRRAKRERGIEARPRQETGHAGLLRLVESLSA